eukprot:67506-Chlamydomonas_euryale.AAC.3
MAGQRLGIDAAGLSSPRPGVLPAPGCWGAAWATETRLAGATLCSRSGFHARGAGAGGRKSSRAAGRRGSDTQAVGRKCGSTAGKRRWDAGTASEGGKQKGAGGRGESSDGHGSDPGSSDRTLKDSVAGGETGMAGVKPLL